MLKPYTKKMYGTLFGDERYHAFGYGFAKGFKKTVPEVEFLIMAPVSSVSFLFGLIIGGPFVGLAAGLLAALVVHCLYDDITALFGAKRGQNLTREARSEAPVFSWFANLVAGKRISAMTGELLGEEVGKDVSLDFGLSDLPNITKRI